MDYNCYKYMKLVKILLGVLCIVLLSWINGNGVLFIPIAILVVLVVRLLIIR